MKILMTNHSLEQRGGAQLYLLEMAEALRQRGHEVAAYSTRLGHVADALKGAAIPVITDPWSCPWRPDTIHGQHHLETMAAMLAFPETPVVYHCHGYLAWRQWAVNHPRILRYLVIGRVLKTRLMVNFSIEEERIRFLPNFVALKHFPQRPPLPEQPRKALIFGNNFEDPDTQAVFREACAEIGITQVDGLGRPFGRMTDKPGPVLAEYDVVFARGRGAIEAAAVGCAVISTDDRRKCELIRAERFDNMRERNFTTPSASGPLIKSELLEQLRLYDAGDAAKVCSLVREHCGLDGSAAEIEKIHLEVLTEWAEMGRAGTRPTLAEEQRAEAVYTRNLVTVVKDLELRWVSEHERRVARDEKVRETRAKLEAEREKTAKLRKRVEELEQKCTKRSLFR